LKPTSMEAMLALAAFSSSGSIAPPDSIQPVPAKAYVTGRLTGTVVYLAATEKSVREYKHHLREYLTLGEQIARGEHLWDAAGGDEGLRLDSGGEEHAVQGPHQPEWTARIAAFADVVPHTCGGGQ